METTAGSQSVYTLELNNLHEANINNIGKLKIKRIAQIYHFLKREKADKMRKNIDQFL